MHQNGREEIYTKGHGHIIEPEKMSEKKREIKFNLFKRKTKYLLDLLK